MDLGWEESCAKFCAQVLVSVALATLSAVLVKQFAPSARGSGIPEPWCLKVVGYNRNHGEGIGKL